MSRERESDGLTVPVESSAPAATVEQESQVKAAAKKKPTRRLGTVEKTKDGVAVAKANGKAKVQPVNAQALADEYEMHWLEGGKFYLRPPGRDKWVPLNDNQFCMFLEALGLRRGNAVNPTGEVEVLKMWVMVNRPIDLVMNLAGYFPGMVVTPEGLKPWIPGGPKRTEPGKGEWPLIGALMEALLMLPLASDVMPAAFVLQGEKTRSREVWKCLCREVDELVYVYDQRPVVWAWLKQSLEILTMRKGGSKVKRGAPALIVAGPKNSGKSLLGDYVVGPLMGSRKSDPSQFLAKDTTFNPDLYRAELACMDDSPLGSDYESRRKMSEFLKQFVAGTVHRYHPKGRDAIVVPTPIRRLIWAINDDKQNLMQLPLMNDSTLDKFSLVHVKKAPLPMPTTSLEEFMAFGDALEAEVPHFAHWLLHEYEIPEILQGGRFGIEAVQAPDLMEELFEDSQHGGMMELIDAARWQEMGNRQSLWQWLSWKPNENYGSAEKGVWTGTHLEIKALLEDEDCTISAEARAFFKKARVDFLLTELMKKTDRVFRPENFRHKVAGQMRREWCIRAAGGEMKEVEPGDAI